MNKLPVLKRIQILSLLCEESSMRSISRVCDVAIKTVSKILVNAGQVCAAYHDQNVRGGECKRVQCDEIWSFCYSWVDVTIEAFIRLPTMVMMIGAQATMPHDRSS